MRDMINAGYGKIFTISGVDLQMSVIGSSICKITRWPSHIAGSPESRHHIEEEVLGLPERPMAEKATWIICWTSLGVEGDNCTGIETYESEAENSLGSWHWWIRCRDMISTIALILWWLLGFRNQMACPFTVVAEFLFALIGCMLTFLTQITLYLTRISEALLSLSNRSNIKWSLLLL